MYSLHTWVTSFLFEALEGQLLVIEQIFFVRKFVDTE